jgi:CspA family cold shock protein
MAVLRGKVVRFDQVRGYGFIASGEGGEDLFVHANDLLDDKYAFLPGTVVEFEEEDGERGPKAAAVRVIEGPARVTDQVPHRAPVVTKAGAAEGSGDDDGLCDVLAAGEFVQETTEVLLDAAPTLTAAQIVQVRQRLVALARQHQWIEG